MKKKTFIVAAAAVVTAAGLFISGNIYENFISASAENSGATGAGVSGQQGYSVPESSLTPGTQLPAASAGKDGSKDGSDSSGSVSKNSDSKEEADKAKEKIKSVKRSHIKKFKVSVKSGKNVRLNWKKNKNAGRYNIYRSGGKNKKYTLIGKSFGNSYRDTRVKERETYRYKVCAAVKVNGKMYEGKLTKGHEAYVLPAHPKTVVSGECFGVAMQLFAKDIFSKNTGFVVKAGMNTLQVLEKNCMSYKGQSVTPLERVALMKPDRVYMIYGANESKNGAPYPSMVNYSRMYHKLKELNSQVQFIILGIPPMGVHSPMNIPSVSQRLAFNKEFQKLSKESRNIYYCPSSQVIGDSSGHLQRKYDAGDGCHWNSAGARTVVSDLKKWSLRTFGNW